MLFGGLRSRWPYLLLVCGVFGLGASIWQLVSPNLSCHGQAMTDKDVCVQTTAGQTTVETLQERRKAVRTDSIIGIVVSPPVIALSAFVVYRRRLRRRAGAYDLRRRLAQSQGWRYESTSQDVLAGWGFRPDYEQRPAHGVVSGHLDGFPLDIFDFTDLDGEHTVWVVTLPVVAGEGLVRWAANGRQLNRRPLTRVTVGDRKIANVSRRAVREINDKELLRPAQRLVQLARGYLADNSGLAPAR